MRIIPYVETRRSHAAPWARRAALLSVAVLVVAMGAHWLQVLETPAFFWAMAVVAGLAVLALVLAAAGMPKVWYRSFHGGADLIVAVLFAVLVLAPLCAAAWWALSHPPLTDISTDLEDPPSFAAALHSRRAGMNPVMTPNEEWRSEQLAAYPNVSGRRYAAPIESVREAVERTFDARGWGILGPYIVGTGIEFSVEATVYSPVLALPSDVVVRLVEDGDATFVDMRSASRYGQTDFGENAARIEAFLKDLDVAVAAMTPVAQGE